MTNSYSLKFFTAAEMTSGLEDSKCNYQNQEYKRTR